MKKLLTVLITLSILFVVIGLLPVHAEAEIYDSVIRASLVTYTTADTFVVVNLRLSVRVEIDCILGTVHVAVTCYTTLAE